MSNHSITSLFTDEKIIQKIKAKLPELFEIAEIECSRDGKVGMEVGSAREQILTALLVYVFGEENVITDIPITKSEEDVRLFNNPISIKTITGINGVKAIWTVDAQKAKEFCEFYKPTADILLAIIMWNIDNENEGLFLIPKIMQEKWIKKLGRGIYLTMPKPGTNPRGVEISKKAISSMVNDKKTYHIEIKWKKSGLKYKTYKRWLEMWEN